MNRGGAEILRSCGRPWTDGEQEAKPTSSLIYVGSSEMRKSLRGAVFAGAAVALFMGVAPARAASSSVVVSPANEHGWQTQHAHCNDLVSTGTQAFVNGPATPPAGTG